MTRANLLLSALSAAVHDLDVLQRGDAYQVVYTVRGVQRCAVACDRTDAIKVAARDVIARKECGTADEREAAERLRAAISLAPVPPGDDGARAEQTNRNTGG